MATFELTVQAAARLTDIARDHGWLMAHQSVQSLTVAGEGNMNRVLRGQLDESDSLIFKQSLPYVAKYPDISAPIERSNMEYAFYNALSHTPLAAQMPHCYGYAAEHHLLCFADLGDARDFAVLYQQPQSIDRQQLAACMTWLSALHQLPAPTTAEFANTSMRRLNHQHIFVLPFDAHNGLEFSPALLQARREIISNAATMQKIQHLGNLYLGLASYGGTPTLLHGDYYPASWIQGPSGPPLIIDPEFAFVGPPEFDLAVALAHLHLAGLQPAEITAIHTTYDQSARLDNKLVTEFAAVEVMRRLLGVAQLPLQMNDTAQAELLHQARLWLSPA